MTIAAGTRRALLTAHVVASVAWLGSVLCFLVLAIFALRSRDQALARGACIALQVTTSAVIVPLSLLSLLTGVLQSLGTRWGLIRHHWVIAKLVLNVAATAVLFIHARLVADLAQAAIAGPLDGDARGVLLQLTVDAAAALLVLTTATALSVFKPKGVTRYGWARAAR